MARRKAAEYSWREGARVCIAADVAGPEIERLERANQHRLTPAAVVEAARPGDSPLHPIFEWEDSEAARLYREEQARYILRCVVVVHETKNGPLPSRALVHIVDEEGDGFYTTLARAIRNDEMREHIKGKARASLISARNWIAQLNALEADTMKHVPTEPLTGTLRRLHEAPAPAGVDA